MTVKIKITGKTKWVKPHEAYGSNYNALIWYAPSGKQETVATVTYFLESWVVWISPEYSDNSYRSGFNTRADAKAYVEGYLGITKKKYARSENWHPFGL